MNREINNYIEKLFSVLREKPDKPDLAQEVIAYLRTLLRMNHSETLPMTEIMTVIKHYKPMVFSELKRRSRNNLMLDILVGLPEDKDVALEKLNEIMNDK